MKAVFEIGISAMHDNAITAVGIASAQKDFYFTTESNPAEIEDDLMNYILDLKVMNTRLGLLLSNIEGPRFTITIKRIE